MFMPLQVNHISGILGGNNIIIYNTCKYSIHCYIVTVFIVQVVDWGREGLCVLLLDLMLQTSSDNLYIATTATHR